MLKLRTFDKENYYIMHIWKWKLCWNYIHLYYIMYFWKGEITYIW